MRVSESVHASTAKARRNSASSRSFASTASARPGGSSPPCHAISASWRSVSMGQLPNDAFAQEFQRPVLELIDGAGGRLQLFGEGRGLAFIEQRVNDMADTLGQLADTGEHGLKLLGACRGGGLFQLVFQQESGIAAEAFQVGRAPAGLLEVAQ